MAERSHLGSYEGRSQAAFVSDFNKQMQDYTGAKISHCWTETRGHVLQCTSEGRRLHDEMKNQVTLKNLDNNKVTFLQQLVELEKQHIANLRQSTSK